MRVLALDTTTREGSVAIVEDDGVVFESGGDPGRSHAERLPGDLVRALTAARLVLSDIDVYAVVSGPGSFAGIRTGIATVQGLACALRKRVVPVSALRVLAEAGALAVPPGALVGAWMDARRQSVFSGLWRVRDVPPFSRDRLEEIEPLGVGDPGEILTRWRRENGAPSLITGDGAVLYAGVVGYLSQVVVAPRLASVVGRIAVARARQGETVDPAGVQPVYVRRPDVELARDLGR